ncbi:U-box domain-containing protein 35-like isoform X5 [Phragmites australis]|uniref:U-box domain-containing protein 35-like isoform X5 n=1 Tax=Phragmites australis TaxID=29695 RepID=UPI002D785749|nr:U-box domain-containing protein 35-like isoform X5 [Phragmites australis]
MEIEEAAGDMEELEAPVVSTVAVAVKGSRSRSSRHALKWALDKFMSEGRVLFRILHVRPAITMVPTPKWGDTFGTANVSFQQPSLPLQRDQALAIINKLSNRRASPSGSIGSEISYNDDPTLTSSHSISEVQFSSSSSGNSIYKSFQRDNQPDNSDQASVSEISANVKHSNDQDDLRLQIERMKVKVRHLHKLEFAQHESFDATQKLHKLGIQHIEDETKLKETELVEDKVRRLVRKQEREEHEAVREAEFKQHSAETEATQGYGDQEANENKTGERIARPCFDENNRYTWEEIQASTSSFSADLVIGKGSYGTVYKAKFHHTTAAVKVLNSPQGCGTQQLQQELEVLGKIRHPHLLMMLGACPEHGCLVYEYMENGSLDGMLLRRNNTPLLTWFDRFRIAWEVATALMFLHSSKPEPIIHRDLKPANILLDRNLISKKGDVGLSTLLPSMGQYQSTMIKNTAPVGTFCYIDPEYQRTGVLSMKSDVYALGIVILQLLTARSPMGLAHVVETALEDGCFVDVLDATAGQWPLNETQELAALALRCSEMRRKDRPDLNECILPTLERLKDVATKAREAALQGHTAPPSHFICPILQEVMVDPYVASDGYTYDRKAIEMWLSMNDKSPMTNLCLPNKSLIPNHSLRSAIMDWRSKSK